MPRRFGTRRTFLSKPTTNIIFVDTFVPDIAAGNVDGTLSSDRKSCRQVTDTENKLPISGGNLVFAGGKTVPAWGDPGIWWTQLDCSTGFARPDSYAYGTAYEFELVADNDAAMLCGLSTVAAADGDPTDASTEHALLFNSDGNIDVIVAGSTAKADAMVYTNGTTYKARFIVYNAGCFYSVSSDGGDTYTALYEDISATTAELFPVISNYNAVFTVGEVLNISSQSLSFADYVTDIPFSEAYSLRDLYRRATGNGWTDNTNWLADTTANNWFGITVAGGTTTVIDLNTNNGAGDLSGWDISGLTSLAYFLLNNNSFTGDLSGWDISGLTSLVVFYLNINSFTGDLSGWDISGLTSLVEFYLNNNSFTGDLSGWDISGLTSLVNFLLYSNSFTGDLSGWDISGLTSLVNLYLNNNSFTGDLSGWDISGLTSLVNLYLNINSFTGDLSGWDISGLTSLVNFLLYSNSFTGDLSGWDISGLTSLVEFYLNNNSFTGDLSGWDISGLTSLVNLYLNNNSFTWVSATGANASKLNDFRIQDNGLSSAHCDNLVEAIYNYRANYTSATPTLNMAGTNSAPSGIYQDGDPPTTGKEYIYELVNDPEAEGFKKWTITYTP